MQVILLEDVYALGKVGQIVTVKNGYAKNLLLPTKKAIIANRGNIGKFEKMKSDLELQNKQKYEFASKIKNVIENKWLVITSPASDDGRVYGSIGAKQIITVMMDDIKNNESIINNEYKIEHYLNGRSIEIKTPIKKIGIHDVLVHLYDDIECAIKINVAKTTGEAEMQEKEYKESNNTVKQESVE